MIRFLFVNILCFVAYLSFGQSQSQMNEQALQDYQKADKELNNIYQKIVKEYKKDFVFIKSLREAQKLWIQFRDAEMKAKYPDSCKGSYGSIQPTCWYKYLTSLTQERTTKLNVWVTGIEEGDVCSGSVKIEH